MKNTKVLTCTCAHKFQDGEHGPKKRVHNFSLKDNDWKCTVCGKSKARR